MIGMRIKHMFFDHKHVHRHVHDAARKVLGHFGGLVRKIAKRSIRIRKRASEPGSPPSSHTGVLKKFIYYAYEPAPPNVVIGPMRTNQVFFEGDGRPVTGTGAEVLEYGGSIFVKEVATEHAGWQKRDLIDKGMTTGWEGNTHWSRADLRSRRRNAGKRTRMRKITIAARPYMGPAFEKAKPQLSAMWAGSVKKHAA